MAQQPLNILMENIQTGAPDHKATALDLFRRAANLTEAVSTLKLPYTYSIARVDNAKQEARRQLGGMAAGIIEDMQDHFIDGAVSYWLRYRGLTQQQVDAIFGKVENAGGTQETPTEPQT